MATYTPNYNLSKPENTDTMEDTIQAYCDNLDKIDENMGGGGGGNADVVHLTQEEYDALPASKTSDHKIYMIEDTFSEGELGRINVNGAFIDTTNIIVARTVIPSNSTVTYTATQDCVVIAEYYGDNNDGNVQIDGKLVSEVYVPYGTTVKSSIAINVKKGQVVSIKTRGYNGGYTVYGIQPASNVVVIPDYLSACYSTSERQIGCWTDGKPLYQKTVYYAGGVNGNVSFAHGISDIDEIVSVEGIAKDTDVVGDFIPFARIRSDSLNIGISDVTLTDVIYYVPSQFGGRIVDIYITIQYTKTTDTAGSGEWTPHGTPTVHYSTEETCIGTWINSKPLYEKTLSIGALPNANESAYPHNISDLKDIIELVGIAIDSNGNNVPIIFANPLSAISQTTAYRSGAYIYVATGLDRRAYNGYITIRYTKTTD